MLIRHLQDLVQDGILHRHQTSTVPPRVHYSISPYGQTLLPVLEVICAWGRRHLQSRETDCPPPPDELALPDNPKK